MKRVDKTLGRQRRRRRVRKKIYGTVERPRLSVFKGNKNISCQMIDDIHGVTLVSASSLENDLRPASGQTKVDIARILGETIAIRAKEKGIQKAVFDRGGYKYHGRVKALAEGARERGLDL
ncbi:MAG: 50S ribosomal protein L18 [Actinomycetota bacterium]|nr:50S ribosomal protein L18 [Actinomycetota bacterium]